MGVNEDGITRIVKRILKEYEFDGTDRIIPVEVSGRHVHLSFEHIEALFGAGYKLTKKKELSQPGQFVSNERVTIFTPKGQIKNVAVLGPARSDTQVELSQTDAKALGLNPPINLSGDTSGASDIYIMSERSMVKAEGTAIVAANHIHMTKGEAKRWGFENGQIVKVKMETERPVTFERVQIRVSDDFRLAMHIDTDEANACAYETGVTAKIICLGTAKIPGAKTPQNKEEKRAISSGEKLITAEKAHEIIKAAQGRITIKKGVIITPLAKDALNDAKIIIEYSQEDKGVNL